ncbi:cytidylate kinase family protein [Candidatus Gottesmanbacteria bacterium]|nr:cytidylate kinase family protein [Candidatus Gottesmanbacteria bacterium]
MFNKVTISGKICTGKTTLFWNLYKHLGWPTFSGSQFFRDYARNHGILLESAKEQIPDLTKEVDLSMARLLKSKDHIIIEGWMAGIMADKIPGVLRILLTSSDRVRAQRFAKREGVALEEAEKSIADRTNNWLTRLEKIYHRADFFDPKNYNFVLDTTYLSEEEMMEKVVQKL